MTKVLIIPAMCIAAIMVIMLVVGISSSLSVKNKRYELSVLDQIKRDWTQVPFSDIQVFQQKCPEGYLNMDWQRQWSSSPGCIITDRYGIKSYKKNIDGNCTQSTTNKKDSNEYSTYPQSPQGYPMNQLYDGKVICLKMAG